MNRNLRNHRLAVAILAAAALVAGPASAQLNQPMHGDGWILAAVHAPGYHGAIWRTDLWIFCDPVEDGTTVELFFNRSGEDNSEVHSVLVPLTVHKENYYIEDVVDHFLGIGDGSWLGAIHYRSNSNLQVWARVYSISPDGTESYGQLIEGIPTGDASPGKDPWRAREYQWMYAVKHTANGRYRVNVGVVNVSGETGTFDVNIYDGAGNVLDGSVRVEVPPYSMVQLSDPFADSFGGEWADVRIRVTPADDEASFFAYASVVDNATNDAFFVRGMKRMRPGD